MTRRLMVGFEFPVFSVDGTRQESQVEQIEFFNVVKRQVIVAILADDDLGDRLVLKGGNLLQFAYEISARASKDVDISVDGDFDDVDALKQKVLSCLSAAFSTRDLVVFDFTFRDRPSELSEDIKSFWGGYLCEFKLIDKQKYDSHSGNSEQLRRLASPLHQTGSTKFKIDFSRHELCDEKEEFEIDGYTICGYSPRMFVAEKLRAICQQMPEYSPIVHRNRPTASRAKDFVDIHVIVQYYGIEFDNPEFKDVVQKTFEQKRVPLELLGKIKDCRDHHEPDFASVRDTVHVGYDLQDFDYYFSSLCARCNALESLWRV
jgi:hypothetical protein